MPIHIYQERVKIEEMPISLFLLRLRLSRNSEIGETAFLILHIHGRGVCV